VTAHGRCAGCRRVGEVKAVGVHIVTCEDWAELYLSRPWAALLPAEEYERWRAAERPAERKADLEVRVADTQAKRAASVARFDVPDLLE
jgi:hypothetical protein